MSALPTDASKPKNPTILETIYAQRSKDVELAKSTPGTTPDDLAALLSMHLSPPLIPLVERLKRNPSSATGNPSPSLMAEIKRASPSKGPIAMTTNAAQQALTYALSGASVISVLTEPTWFKGSLLDMRLVRQAVDGLPDRPAILRKEFILDEYQIAEARLHGADTVLLIVAMLSPERLKALYVYSLSLGMEPLVEVNNANEMSTALKLGAKVIGVNNRNLHDFHVDMGTTSRLVEMVRERDVILCALSGISSAKDVQLYKEQGVRAVLVGEALMRAQDTSAFIRELLQWPEKAPKETKKEQVWVKVSGITSLNEAVSLADAGADMLGLIFDTESKHHVTLEVAAEIASTIRASRSSRRPLQAPPSAPTSAPWFTTQKRHIASTAVRPLLVGVFKDQPLPYILHAAANAQLDLVQFDGAEPAGWVKHIPVPVIRTYRDAGGITRPGLHSFSRLRLDTSSSYESGENAGAKQAREVVEAGEIPNWPMPVILSGGLTIQNIGEVVRQVGPWVVEVEKEDELAFDVKTVEAFVKAAKEA